MVSLLSSTIYLTLDIIALLYVRPSIQWAPQERHSQAIHGFNGVCVFRVTQVAFSSRQAFEPQGCAMFFVFYFFVNREMPRFS